MSPQNIIDNWNQICSELSLLSRLELPLHEDRDQGLNLYAKSKVDKESSFGSEARVSNL